MDRINTPRNGFRGSGDRARDEIHERSWISGSASRCRVALATLLGNENADVGYWAATLLGRLGTDVGNDHSPDVNGGPKVQRRRKVQRSGWKITLSLLSSF